MSGYEIINSDTIKIIKLTPEVINSLSKYNKIVLNYCIQQVYSEAQGYMKYVDDASTLVVPIAHPVQASNNDRQLEFKGWF